MNTQHSYQSTFSWRYGSDEMREIFSLNHKILLWRKIWVVLARAQYKAGLLTKKEVDDIAKHENEINTSLLQKIEKETQHDVVAAIKEFASHCGVGGGKIHLGATSMDITDNADMICTVQALRRIKKLLTQLLLNFSEQIQKYADTACMGYTHLQPAEPTTIGYRLANYAQDLLTSYFFLEFVQKTIKAKGIKGAVGTAASFSLLLKQSDMTVQELENVVMKELDLQASQITTQVYPRLYDGLVGNVLSCIATSCQRFAEDIRILQSPNFGEWSEPFGKNQVGSSAMPFKKNPITSEKICSLSRLVAQSAPIQMQNAALSHLERTLDDSANRREIIPQLFLATDEILLSTTKVIKGLQIHKNRIAHQLDTYAPFSATETVLLMLVDKGRNRQDMHELLRSVSLQAWEHISNGKKNPMKELLINHEVIGAVLSPDQIEQALNVSHHTGNAAKRAKDLAKQIQKTVS